MGNSSWIVLAKLQSKCYDNEGICYVINAKVLDHNSSLIVYVLRA